MLQQDLQKQALNNLYDISTQQYQKSRLNWRNKSTYHEHKERKRIKSDKSRDIILPTISSNSIVSNPVKKSPLMMRKKPFKHKQRMKQILGILEKKKSLPSYDINKQFSSQIEMYNQMYANNTSALSKHSQSRSNLKRKYYTEIYSQQKCLKNTIDTNQNSQKKFSIQEYVSSGETQILKRNWSIHLSKVVSNIKKNKQNTFHQIQQIKKLITDKRNKFRKLSRQGYLIVKNQLSNSRSGKINFKIQTKSKSKQQESTKNSRLLKISDNQQEERITIQNKQELPLLQISHKIINLPQQKGSKNFLKSACSILKINNLKNKNSQIHA